MFKFAYTQNLDSKYLIQYQAV